jgi:hypothetical protein
MMDEAAFRKDLESGAFQFGLLEGYWEIPPAPPAAWPYWFVTVRSNLPTVNGGAITLRFTLDGYPARPPQATPWDLAKNAPLTAADYPKGPRTLTQAFNPNWHGGQALYLPCDRSARDGHPAWKTQHPDYYWQPTFTIATYLQCVRRCLNPFRYDNQDKPLPVA